MGKLLIGQFNNKMDNQGRVVIPSKLSFEDSEAVLVKGFEKCLYLYPKKEFERLLDDMNKLPFTKQSNREFIRLFLANAYEVDIDSKSRISMPSNLCSFACLSGNVVIIGTGSKLEIWDEDEWNNYYNQNALKLNDIANEVTF